MNDCCLVRWRAKANVGIVREAETLLWDSEEIAIELVIFVFIVDCNNSVIARRQILHDGCSFVGAGRNGSRPVVNRLAHVFGPAAGRTEDGCANDTDGIAKPINVDAECAG